MLATITVVGVLLNVLVFYPGYMSNDSLAYLYQAKGWAPLDSLHPIFMALFWGILIKLTGYTSSMLLVQALLLWGSSLLIALFVYRQTKSRRLSILVTLLPLLPYVFSISGVLWSDIVYAGFMMLAVALSLWLGVIKSKRQRVALLVITLGILMTAVMVRYNTIPAVTPIIVLALYRSKLFSRKTVIAGITVAIMVGAIGLLVALSNVLHVKDEKLMNGPKLDDIVNIAPRELVTANTSGEAERYLMKIYDCSVVRNVRLDVIHNCGAKGDEAFALAAPHTESIQRVWSKAIGRDPFAYLSYRIAGYVSFLFPAEQARYIWHEGIDKNRFEIEVKYPHLGAAVSTIVHNLFYKYFSFLYEPWFWLVTSLTLAYCAIRTRRRELKHILLALSLSSALVILSYFPTGATVDYRYVYWPAIASTISIILLAIDVRPRLLAKIKKYHTTQDQ